MSDIYGAEDLPPPAVQRVRNSFFTPLGGTLGKVGASKALLAPTPDVRMPSAPTGASQSAASSDGTGGVLNSLTKLWNAPFDQKRRQEKTAEEKRIQDQIDEIRRVQAAGPGAVQATATGAGDGTTAAPGTTPGGGVLQGRPIPGDSYEAKVGGFESSDNDAAVNKTSGASGRYQFMPSTAEGIIKAHPELNISANWRTNRDDQQKLMKVYTDTSREILRKQLGRDPTGGELYALHLFGHGKGPSIVGGGAAPLVSLTNEAERSGNPFLNNFKTAGDLLTYFNQRFG